jgi:hypothetical protein
VRRAGKIRSREKENEEGEGKRSKGKTRHKKGRFNERTKPVKEHREHHPR